MIQGKLDGIHTKLVKINVALVLVLLGLWNFPRFWYSRGGDPAKGFWLSNEKGLSGWRFDVEPISPEAEFVLAADAVVNGTFVCTTNDAKVQVFSAKRFAPGDGDLDMFSHTPDRCWTSVGWKIDPDLPETVDLAISDVRLRWERRVFSSGPKRELVYFGALVGGRPLPYRLDQYRNIALRRNEAARTGIFTKALAAFDFRFLTWPWKVFLNRQPLAGPKQFFRVSTSLQDRNPQDSDTLLQNFLKLWLVSVEYKTDLQRWKMNGAAPQGKL